MGAMGAATTHVVLTVLLIALCLMCALAIYFLARLRFKAQNEGSFNVAWRPSAGDSWVAGVCHYSEDKLKWYRIISLRWGSDLRWPRTDFEILESAVEADEASDLRLAILHCQSAGQDFWLAMDEHDYSGIVSWKESSPPRPTVVY